MSTEPRQWFAWTLTDVVSQMTLGSISTLSSALILYIIYRSPVKLKSTYHRIMTLLSSCDICLSVPLALATIPMPKSMVPYKGPTLGTDGTCIAQGLFMYFGAGSTADVTLCLAGYYVCIALHVSNRTITRIYEPISYTYIMLINLVPTYLAWRLGNINIRHWSAYCGPSPIPSYCWYEETWMGMADTTTGVDLRKCAWPEEPNMFLKMETFFKYYVLAVSVLLIIAMLIVISVVCRNEKVMIKEEIEEKDSHDEEENVNDTDANANANASSDGDRHLKQTRLIVRQAILYILAFFFTWIFVIIPWDEKSPKIYDILESVLFPLGGFWNMLIFVHIKIQLIREANPTTIDSNFKAFMVLIKEPDTVPEMVLDGMENVVIIDRPLVYDNPAEDLSEEDLSEEESSSKFTSNPSAYDGLSSRATPTDASHGLSGASQWDQTDDEKNYAPVTPGSVHNLQATATATTTNFSSSKASESSSSGKESSSKESSTRSSRDMESNTSEASVKSDLIVKDETKQVYKYYPETATKFKKKVGLVITSDDRSNSDASPNSVLDDLSSTGLSIGGPSYGGLSNEMPPIMEVDGQE